jgi:hypothetical protein
MTEPKQIVTTATHQLLSTSQRLHELAGELAAELFQGAKVRLPRDDDEAGRMAGQVVAVTQTVQQSVDELEKLMTTWGGEWRTLRRKL